MFSDWDPDREVYDSADMGMLYGGDPQPRQAQVAAAAPRQAPMFSLIRLDYEPKDLRRLVVSNGIVIMALGNGHIIRVNMDTKDLEDVDITKDKIHGLFLDPTGVHLLISTSSGDNYYLHQKYRKPKMLQKAKGVVIESVGWDAENDATSTKEILVGTSEGRIFKALIETGRDMKDCKERFFTPVYNIGDTMRVTNIRVERFPDATKYLVFVTTPTRLYEFIGGPTFDDMFSAYSSAQYGFKEVPGSLTYSELHFYHQYGSQGLPAYFAWLTEPGIFYGELTFGSQNSGDSVMSDNVIITYPASRSHSSPNSAASPTGPADPVSAHGGTSSGPALSLAVTEYHFLVVYPDRFQAICRLDESVSYEDSFSHRIGMVRGLAKDPTRGVIWLYTDSALFEVGIHEEDRHVWSKYLERGSYELALKSCKTAKQRDAVLSEQAEHYFDKGAFDLAAQFYGKSRQQFEEVCLKFIDKNERDALMTYLEFKLQHLSPAEPTQRTIISTWLVELFLAKLNRLLDEGNDDEADRVSDEFTQFLSERKELLDPTTTMSLISAHGRLRELLFYAKLEEDYERVINYHIQHGEYNKALVVLTRQPSADLYYQFSPILMHHVPYFTVNAWMQAKGNLNPRSLIPSLMRYDPAFNTKDHQENQAIRYLEYCVNTLYNTDEAIHNYLLSLYAQEEDDTALLQFINHDDVYFDLKYALRLCTKYNKIEACVHIYSAMELYEEAVDLALKVDLNLAKINADKPEDDDELRKKLWLRIARHVVSDTKDIKRAMEFLSGTNCELLKIEDILPFFPDFTQIDYFREDICASLEEYNRHIDELKGDMDVATRSAELIRTDIKKLRHKYGFVDGAQKCHLCETAVLTRPFYLFPCQHVFHEDCMADAMMNHLSPSQQGQVRELRARIREMESMPAADRDASAATASLVPVQSEVERLKANLDDLQASECLYCGTIMIESISQNFICDDDAAQAASWAV